jgi:hypothetical protein
VQVRLTAAELRRYTLAAGRCGLSFSAWLRRACDYAADLAEVGTPSPRRRPR